MAAVPASEVQKNFGEWADKAFEGPIEITRYGRTTAYLVSAPFFKELLASYRKSVPAHELGEAEMTLIRESRIEDGEAYDLDDLPEVRTSVGDRG